MGFIDPDTKQPLTPDQLKQLIATPGEAAAKVASGTKYLATHPKQDVQGVGSFLKRNAIPMGVMGGTGLALDLAFPEAGIPLTLGRAALTGVENATMNKTLPKQLGGDPETPPGWGFLYGAAPELAVGGAGVLKRGLDRRVGKAAAGAAERTVEKLDPEAQAARSPLMGPKGTEPFPNNTTGNESTAQAFEAQSPVQATITAARNKYGAPIGEAYKALKGEQPVDAQGFAKVADNIQSSMLSPASGKAQALLGRFKALDPEVQRQTWEQQQAARAATPGSNITAARETPSMNKLQQRIQEQLHGSSMEAGGFRAQPATLDALRSLRQGVNASLRGAQGGDLHMLGSLQDAIDQELMPHLPANMQQLRKNYAGFMNRWSYRDMAQLSKLETPQQVADWTFKDPAKAHDLLSEAAAMGPKTGRASETTITINGHTTTTDPETLRRLKEVDAQDWPLFLKEQAKSGILKRSQRQIRPIELTKDQIVENPQLEKLRELFVQHVYGNLNDATMSAKEQVVAVRKNLAPYMKDRKTAELVMGPQAGQKMQQMVAWPKYTADFKEKYTKDPKFRSQFEAGIKAEIMKGGVPDQSAQKMLMALSQGDPGTEQIIPQLPAPMEGAKGPQNLSSKIGGIARHGAILGAGALTGHTMGASWQLGMIASYFLMNPARSFASASRLGITVPMLKAMGSENGFFAAKQIARTILNAGGRKAQEVELGQ
jgi:hypothetical protein